MDNCEQMKFYMAPLEGITGYIFRRAYHNHFQPMDKYFTPFLVPHTKKGFSAKEKSDILPENNQGMYVVPQIMSNDAEMFLGTVEKLRVYGYEEVNLNLGCPSKTVVSKYRGSGFLSKKEELKRFLDFIYGKTPIKISIKTRLGKESPEEFVHLLELYDQYPVEELIIHPRVQQDLYRGTPRLEWYQFATENSTHALCYNGDIYTAEDYHKIKEQFPDTDRMMLGRGILSNPLLLNYLCYTYAEEDKDTTTSEKEAKTLLAFLEQIREDYLAIGMGEKNTLFKLKELWCYMGKNCPQGENILVAIRKSQSIQEYLVFEREIMSSLSEM